MYSNCSKNNENNDFNSFDSVFIDEEVQRFDADSYKEKYGDRWKKLATTVRDVVQSDGTVIREYVIDDPSMLEQLSEDEEDNEKHQTIKNNIQTNHLTEKKHYELESKLENLANYMNKGNESVKKNAPYDLQLLNNLNLNKTSEIYLKPTKNNENLQTVISNDERNIYFKPILTNSNVINYSYNIDQNKVTNKFINNSLMSASNSKLANEVEADQEVE